jgi:hypothetical protein
MQVELEYPGRFSLFIPYLVTKLNRFFRAIAWSFGNAFSATVQGSPMGKMSNVKIQISNGSSGDM